MFNIEIIEKLSREEGKNLVSIYLDVNREKYSNLVIKNKAKDALKSVNIENELKSDLKKKLFDFLSRTARDTKSVAFFYNNGSFYSYVFSQELEDFVSVDDFFNLEPLLLLLSENRNVGVMLINSEEARFFAVFLGQIKAHRHIEDRIIRRHKKGGWSQARFERKIDEEIKHHLKNCADFLGKMNKIYNFDFILLECNQEIGAEFKKILPKKLLDKIAGEIKVEFNVSPSKIIEKVDELVKKEVKKEKHTELKSLEEIIRSRHGEEKAVAGLIEVARAMYDKKILKIVVNKDFSEAGFYCHFCGYVALSEEFCPYDQTPNYRVRNVVNVILDQAVANKIEVEVLDKDPILKRLGEIVGILRQ